jgi:hypothetical protein
LHLTDVEGLQTQFADFSMQQKAEMAKMAEMITDYKRQQNVAKAGSRPTFRCGLLF